MPAAAGGPETAPAVDLVVSMRTELLESQPRLAVHSRLPAGEVLELADGCWLFRFPRHEISYAEMVHPADFQGSELDYVAERDRAVEVRHRLFVEHLEKGVILRARVRGALLRRHDDAALAAAVYAAFASADPPLGS